MVITSSNPNDTQLVKANFLKWVLTLKFKKHKAGQMAGDILKCEPCCCFLGLDFIHFLN